jgi:hypothetical protein
MPLTEADFNKAYAFAFDGIQGRIKARAGRNCLVVFSAYGLDADKVPIDNLDDVPVPGKLIIRGKRDPNHGTYRSKDYESPIMDGPTWLDLCVIANDQMVTTRNRDHRYLEHVEVVGNMGDIQIAAFCLGA